LNTSRTEPGRFDWSIEDIESETTTLQLDIVMQQGLLVFNQTVIHPAALIATLIAGALILALPRRWAIAPFLAAAIFIPIQQQIVFATLDFRMLRFLIVFAWLRVSSLKASLALTGIDKSYSYGRLPAPSSPCFGKLRSAGLSPRHRF
jgi:hypothetical protein